MVKLYRIASKAYINDLSGTGAKLYGGRWNSKGHAMLYCSENSSLAILEILVHFDGLTVPKDLHLLQLSLSERYIEDFSESKFNRIRKSKMAEYKFKEEGDRWLLAESSLVLRVPSIITRGESNMLINQMHPSMQKLKTVKVEKLELDERLFGRSSDT